MNQPVKTGHSLSYGRILLIIFLLLGDVGGGTGMPNCLLSKKLCSEDASCRSILEIIPRVCGPETVACSTVTVNKCLAALRTVKGFPYFYPVCLCREPHLDQTCNAFREYIFDHPCEFVHQKKDRPPYAVDALPTCDYAIKTCQQLPACFHVYDKFRSACKVRDGHCRMQDSEACLLAWTQLKQLPMFGCICPSENFKQKCDNIFDVVHKNPCVDAFLASSAPSHKRDGQGAAWDLLRVPVAPSYHSPYPTAHPYPVPPLYRNMHVPYVVHITQTPPYSAQTSNVLSVPVPTFLDKFPVSVIPLDNSTFNGGSNRVQNPLVKGERDGGLSNVSPAVSVLGRDRETKTDKDSSVSFFQGNRLPSLNSTCETALEGCLRYPGCRRLLNPAMGSCGETSCNRERCMDDLQTFYRNVENKWAMEIAFCLCKKTNSTTDRCLMAQEKLHPTCARMHSGTAPLLCSELARSCKDDISCRHRLEFYEQACAVDSDTQRCAGPTTECRRALLGILGTRLRNRCTCASPSTKETYACVDWQRILWFNPCVVESQTEYHKPMLIKMRPGDRVMTSSSIIEMYASTTPWTPTRGSYSGRIVDPYPNLRDLSTPNSQLKVQTSTSTSTTTTPPPEYCAKKLRNSNVDYIAEGESKRYYKEIDSCSELCQCFIGKNLVCNVIECVPSFPCETNFAVYIHAAPAYQASRGECICYSKDFICARPPQEEYNIDEGVYLMIGYSKKEEELLRPWTKQGVRDTVPRLRRIFQETQSSMNGQRERRLSNTDVYAEKTLCQLDLKNLVGENLVLQASLIEFNDNRENMTAEMLSREKDECEPPLRTLSTLINEKDPTAHQDPLLSMFLLSEVQSHIPPVVGSSYQLQPTISLIVSVAIVSRFLSL